MLSQTPLEESGIYAIIISDRSISKKARKHMSFDLLYEDTKDLPSYGSEEEAALLDELSRIFGAAGPVSQEIIEDRGER